jgi:hypothetical protein
LTGRARGVAFEMMSSVFMLVPLEGRRLP